MIPAFFTCLKETDEPIGFAGIKEIEEGGYEYIALNYTLYNPEYR